MLGQSNLTAGDVMTRDVATAFPDTSVRYIAKLMADRHVSGIPIVDEQHHVVGIVSENDLLQWSDEPGEKQAWWLSMLTEGFELSPDSLDIVQFEQSKASRIMKSPVFCVEETTRLEDVAKLMVQKSVKRLPVVSGGKLVGIISRTDLVEVLARS